MRTFAIFCFIFAFTACVDFKSDFPKTNYYKLTQSKTETGVGSKIPGTLLIKDVEFPGLYDTQFLIEYFDESKAKKYHYHKWLDRPQVIVTDFIRTRLNLFEAFSGSVIEPGSALYPDYVLETTILKFDAHNSEDSSFVEVSAKAVLYQKKRQSPETKNLLSEVFEANVLRTSNKISSIAPAYSKALSILTDNIAYKVQNTILELK